MRRINKKKKGAVRREVIIKVVPNYSDRKHYEEESTISTLNMIYFTGEIYIVFI